MSAIKSHAYVDTDFKRRILAVYMKFNTDRIVQPWFQGML